MSKKKRSLPFLIYSETWDPAENKDIELLWKNGRITLIHEFDPKLVDLKRYFCPRCGYFGIRTKKEIEEGDEVELRKAYFSHKNPTRREKRPKCFLGEKYKPEHHLTENSKIEAELSGRLARVREWLDDVVTDELPLDPGLSGETPYLSTDFDNLQESGVRGKNTSPRDITSLQFIVDHIEEFLCKEIELPGYSIQKLFRDIFSHVSEVHLVEDEQQYIFWGRVREVFVVEDYVRIRFGYKTHCLDIAVKEDIIERRNISLDALRGKTIAVAGIVRRSKAHTQKAEDERGSKRPCYLIGIRKRGAFAIVKEEKLNYFRLPEVCDWVDPVSGEEPDDSEGFYSFDRENIHSDDLKDTNSQENKDLKRDTPNIFKSIQNFLGEMLTRFLNWIRRF